MPKASSAVAAMARSIVRVRDGHRCQMCGQSIVDVESSIHHRINRGSGGSALRDRASLLIRLCGSGTTRCHGWVTEHSLQAAGLGWVLPKLNPEIDPTREPIFTIHGWVLLDDLGNRTPVPSPQARP